MGYIAHHAIVVTSWDDDRANMAQKKAKEIGLQVTEVIRSKVNGYSTFLIGPDGSKEGWPDSDEGDDARATWMQWAVTSREEGGPGFINWVLVRYGGDEPELAKVLARE